MQQLFLENPWIVWLLIVWTLPWKGLALWKAARRAQVWWFAAMLVVNTLAILEILYIFIWSKKKKPVSETVLT